MNDATLDPPAATAAATRSRILTQARVHLFNHGYTGFTMDALATELGMSKKTLYVHFRSKDAIIRTAISTFGAGVRAEADTILAQPRLTFCEKLRGFAQTMMERLEAIRPAVVRDVQRAAPHIYKHMLQVRSENLSYAFGRFIEEGQLAGAVRDDISPVFAGEFYVHAIQGMMSADAMQRLNLTPAETFDRALRLFFGGLLTPSGQKEYEKTFPH